MDARFSSPAALSELRPGWVYQELARRGISGGATYDGLVALAASSNDLVLATRDARARVTYEAVGARVVLLIDAGNNAGA